MNLRRRLIILRYCINGFIVSRILRMTAAEHFTIGIGQSGLGDKLNEAYFATGTAVARITFFSATDNAFRTIVEIENPHKEPIEVEP